jgi:hypothetical protein
VTKFLICKVHDLIPDIETLAMSGRGNIDAISIFFPILIKDFTMDLSLPFVFSNTILFNRMTI